MTGIVLAALLSAVTPLTPSPSPTPLTYRASSSVPLPAGWAPDLQTEARLLATQQIQWRWRGHGYAALNVRLLPESLPVPTIARLLVATRTRVIGRWTTRMRNASLCGAPGAILTASSGGAKPLVDELVLESVNGANYAFTYAHGGNGGAADDAGTERFIRTACPGSPAAFSALSAPPTWSSIPSPRIDAWSGPEVGDEFIELNGPRGQLFPFLNAIHFARTLGINGHVLDEKNVISTHCGHVAREESATLSAGTYHLHIDMMYVRENDRDAILFSYATTHDLDPSILAVLRAYCPSR